MIETRSRRFAITAALLLAFAAVACSGEPEPSTEGSSEASRAESAGEPAVAASPTAEGSEEAGEHREGGEAGEAGEAREGGEHGEGEEGGEHDAGGEEEESGVYIARGDTWDAVRRGARLVLTFDASSNTFGGTVENTTEATLCAVRVEVHLSSGTELGPTERTDVSAGQSIPIGLPTGGEAFETWTAHPESAGCGG